MSMAGKLVSHLKQSAIAKIGDIAPLLKDSQFRETGMITPDEFVAAGDYLVYHCPTWQWEPGDTSKHKAYLPCDKQFLATKKVPCYRRCHQISVVPENSKVIKLNVDDAEEEGWIDTHHGSNIEQVTEEVTEMTLEDSNLSISQESKLVGAVDSDEDNSDDEPVLSMDDYEEDDPATLLPKPTMLKDNKGGVLQTRTYDLNITYDNYYRTPRLWLFGYNEFGVPLPEEQMYEDISQDHLNKTVTLEQHPHLPPPPKASVHPCRHAELMKKIITMIEEDGREMHVDSYLLIFLKFVQAVIPTIEYDYTQQLALTATKEN